MNNEKDQFLTVSWLSGLLSAEIFISTGEWGVQMTPLTSENGHFLRSGPQEATLVMSDATFYACFLLLPCRSVDRRWSGIWVCNLGTITSSNGNIFRFMVLLLRVLARHRWIPLTKASDAKLWCLLLYAPEQPVEQTIETPVILDAVALIITSR